jgi:2,4-dienoyl-CoA reductase-like NADH-dependent reductase (Old Yellow Enzyme family)
VSRLKRLFTIKTMDLKNRVLRSATMEYMADLEGFATDDLLKLYYDLARGGTGIIITGCTAVEEEGRAWDHQLAIWDDKFINGLRKLADVIHTYGDGCKCAIQLFHQGTVKYDRFCGQVGKGLSLKDLTESEIKKIVVAFGEAARRTKEAAFDAVAVHGAHGYLLSEFLSSATNERVDDWGGSLENRMRFTLEVYKSIRDKVGNDFPILWKLNTADYVDRGMGVRDYAIVAQHLAQVGVDLIEMSGGIKEQAKLRPKLQKEAGAKEAYFLSAVPFFRQAVGNAALALTGGMRSLEVMQGLLKNGIDLIGICRPLICEPNLPNRLLYSPDKRKAKCTSCNKCLIRISRQPVKCVEFDEFHNLMGTHIGD